ncbi:MAG: hypothetical protein AAF639_30435 [Chloroflexota bacterium]
MSTLSTESLLTILQSQGVFGVVQTLTQQTDTQAVMNAYNDLVAHLYWKAKNVAALTTLGIAGIQHGLAAVVATDDSESATTLKSGVKTLAYNLASYTWPGWDEPGITLGRTEVLIGLDAARLCLSLSEELNQPELPRSRTHWLVGTALMAAASWAVDEVAQDNLVQALEHFSSAVTLANGVNERGDALLSQGFETLTRLLMNPDDNDAKAELVEVKVQLSELEQSEFYIGQIDTAVRVFGVDV